jgi:hypothetical protein
MLSKQEHLQSLISCNFSRDAYNNSYNPTSGILVLNTYKLLHSLTFAISSLYNQQQALALIFISNAPSVSYCSTVMLYAVFNFLSAVYFNKCAYQYIKERDLRCGHFRYRYIWGGGADDT